MRFAKFDEAQYALQDFPDGINNFPMCDEKFKIRVSVALSKEEKEKRALKKMVCYVLAHITLGYQKLMHR